MNSALNTLTTIHIELPVEFHKLEIWPHWPPSQGWLLCPTGCKTEFAIIFDTPSLQYTKAANWATYEFIGFAYCSCNKEVHTTYQKFDITIKEIE